MFDHLSSEQVTDVRIAVTAFVLLAVLRVGVYAWDTRNDFDRPKKHGDMRKREQ